jgi:uncharacterized protein
MKNKFGFLFLFLIFYVSTAKADFKIPSLTGPVVDDAHVLSYEDSRIAETVIRRLYESGQAQLVLVTLPSLEGQTIEQIGIQIADKWKLGTKEQDNGIILIAAVQERKMRIEVGQGLEGTIPDAVANRIIEDIIVPSIHNSDLSKGLSTGVFAIAQRIDPNVLNGMDSSNIAQRPSGRRIRDGLGFLIFIIIFLAIKFLNVLFYGRRRSRYGGWGGGGFGGGFGGGGFGGGGFGGGGGGFSGGGASGSW